MGRHSSSRQWGFYRSLLSWSLPWLVMAAIAGIAVWFAVAALGREELSPPAAPQSDVALVDETPTPSPTPTLELVEPTRSPSAAPAKPVPPLITDVSVQVLNATPDSAAGDRMAERLAELGFQVVTVQPAGQTYEQTTVFWSHEGAEDAARALAERYGWLVAERPDNLSETVDVHVVVGADQV
ncbi:MAG TPA: LytR C-terminal domain-containing protein [Actinomycetota bacterium]|nr:LytR C-terminal domain-containing protein [Actinomycetota bacterium]